MPEGGHPGAPWQERAAVTPRLLPREQWSSELKVLRSMSVFEMENGELIAPPYPGLEPDVDKDPPARFRVRT